METIAVRSTSWRSRLLVRGDLEPLAIWALAAGTVLYQALDGGGYDLIVHSQVAVATWWIVLVGAAAKLLPMARFTRSAWAAVALFGAFVTWTALALSWSLSSERSLQSLSLVAGYLGVLVLGVAINRDRRRAITHTAAAVACAVALVACLALASRLHPGLFHGALQTASFLHGTLRRLSWPLNYWNALAALLALGLPLLLGFATSARRLWVQASAAAAIPVVALSGYLTFSRGGAIAAAVAVLAFYALAPERIPKLGTGLVAAAGSAGLIAGAAHRTALQHGLADAAARHQGSTLIVAIVLVCAGVGLAQLGIGLAARHATPPRLLSVPPRRAAVLLAGTIAVLVAVALAAGAPGRLSHAWRDFKKPAVGSALNSPARFGSFNSNGRYELWKAAVNATGGHALRGSGAGTYQLLWLPRAPRSRNVGYVQNAHSLYFETLAELGVVGLLVLVSFVVLVLACAVRAVVRAKDENRTRAAGVAAALLAFAVSALFDWIWQVPALPAAFLLLAAAVLAPSRGRTDAGAPAPTRIRVAIRGATVALSLGCLAAIAIPLATASAVRQSQAAASRGDLSRALAEARQAARIEPDAASPQVQLALVLEADGDVRDAISAATRATNNEPANWSTWLILSRLEAEAGHARASTAAYVRARSLNPTSSLFKS